MTAKKKSIFSKVARHICCRTFRLWLLVAILLSGYFCESGYTQVRAGSAYLKIVPGARQQNLGGSLTAGLDEPYSIYANAAAVGFLRETQFSFSHSRWISDITNSSVLFGKQFHPWQKRLNLALGFNYQGVDFESTGGLQPATSSQDYLATLSLGFPVVGKRHSLALGITAKHLYTKLDQYSGNAFAFDGGLLYRTSRFRLSQGPRGMFGIFSLGLSLNHVGKPITFITESTPLPWTVRVGSSFNFGRHDGPQTQLLFDYHKVNDEVHTFSIGAEIQNFFSIFLSDSSRWSRLMSVRGGYHFNSNRNTRILSKFTFGLSIRLDDYMNNSLSAGRKRNHGGRIEVSRPIQNSALRGDFGFYNSATFTNVYQGSGTWFKVGPEAYDFEHSPYHSVNIGQMPDSLYWTSEPVEFAWQPANDPDLYDQVNYLLMISTNSASVQKRLTAVQDSGAAAFSENALQHQLKVAREGNQSRVSFAYIKENSDNQNAFLSSITGLNFDLADNDDILKCRLPAQADSGSYYWSVLAYDKNLHFRPIAEEGRNIRRFHIRRYPDLDIRITNARWQKGTYLVDVVLSDLNETILPEEFPVQIDVLSTSGSTVLPQTTIYGPRFHHIQRGESITIPVNWDPRFANIHASVNLAPAVGSVHEKNYLSSRDVYSNNSEVDTLVWYDLAVKKTVSVAEFSPHVHFNSGKSTLLPLDRQELARLSKAFNDSVLSNFYISVNGHTDQMGWRGLSPAAGIQRNCRLSSDRVQSVSDFLTGMGRVRPARVSVTGFGQTQLLVKNAKSAADHARNRRVVVRMFQQPCLNITNANCTIVAPCTATPVNLVDSNEDINYEISISNIDGFAAKNFEVHEQVPATMTTLNYFPRPPDDIIKGASKELIWRFPRLGRGATPIQVKYTGKMPMKVAGAQQVTTVTQVAFPNAADRSGLNNRASADVYLIGKPGPPEPFYHTVKCNETLSLLAQYYYGDVKKYLKIFHSNRGTVTHPDRIYDGAKLEISGKLAQPGLPAKSLGLPYVKIQKSGEPIIGSKIMGSYTYNHCEPEGQSRLRWYVNDALVQEDRGPGGRSEYLVGNVPGAIIRFEVTPVTEAPHSLAGTPVSIDFGPVKK